MDLDRYQRLFGPLQTAETTSTPTVDPYLVELAKLNPNNASIQNLVLQSMLDQREQQKQAEQQSALMQAIFGGEQGAQTAVEPSNPWTMPESMKALVPTATESVQQDTGTQSPQVEPLMKRVLKGVLNAPSKMGYAITKTANDLAGVNTDPSIYGYLLDEQTRKNIENDPFGEGFVKPVSTAAGYGASAALIPVKGMNFLQTVGRGTLGGGVSGALGGFGGSDPGEEVANTLKGLGIGGVTGGVLSGLGYGASKLSEAAKKSSSGLGESMSRKAIGIKTPKTPQGYAQAQDLAADVTNITGEYGEKVSPKGISNTFGKISSKLGNALKKSEATVDADNMILDAADKLKLNMPKDITDDQAIKLVQSQFGGKTGVVSAKDLAAMKKTLQSAAIKARDAFERNGTLSVEKRALLEAYDVIDSSLKNVTPEARGLYTKLAKLYEAAPDIVTQADKQGYVTIGATKVPTLGLPNLAQRGGGRLFSMIGDIPNTGKLENIGKLGTAIGIPAATGSVGGSADTNQVPANSDYYTPSAPVNSNENTQSSVAGSGVYGGQSTGGINQDALSRAVLAGLIDPTTAKYLTDMYGASTGTSEKLTENQKKFAAAGQMASEALDLLENQGAKTGKVAKAGSSIGKFFGTQSPTQTSYYSKLDSARSVAISALSGANVPPSEYERMVNMIPDPKDERGIAIQKLKDFAHAMKVYSAGGLGDTTSITYSPYQ